MNILAYLQPALFYLIPIVIGRAVYLISVKKNEENEEKNAVHSLFNLAKYFITGSLFLLVLAFLMKTVTGLVDVSFSLTYFLIVYILAGTSLIFSFLKRPHFSKKMLKEFGFILFFVLTFSMIATGIWKWRTPYQMNWDFYQHQTLATLMLKQDSFNFFTSKMSDTFGFNSYPPFFHLLLATAQFGSDLSPTYIVSFWDNISFLHLLTVSLASYLLGFAVTKKRVIAILSCLVGTLVFDSVISFTSLFFLPQTLCAVLFIWIFSKYLWQSEKNKKLSVVGLIFSGIALVMLHYIVGFLATAILILEWIYFRFNHSVTKLITNLPIVQLGILTAIAAVVGSHFVNLSFLNNGEGEFYVFSLMEKAQFAQRIYGFSLLFLIPLGIVASYQLLTKQLKFTFLMIFGLLCILVSQFPYVLKFYVIARFFTHLIMAIGLWGLVNSMHFKFSKLLALSVISTAFTLILISNTLYWKQGLFDSTQFAHINQDDLAAAQFLKDFDLQHKTLIISDPATQFILEGLSGVNSVTGVYGTQEQRERLFQIASLNSAEETKNAILATSDGLEAPPQTRLLILSGRTRLWADSPEKDRNSYNFNVWAPKTLSLSDLVKIQQIKESYPGFVLIYQNPSIAIFRLESQ